MLQYVQVHQLEEFASRDCGKARVEVVIRDSMGPAANNEATERCTNTVKMVRIAVRFLALLGHLPRTPPIGIPRVSFPPIYQLEGHATVPNVTVLR
jgi:hypothetical protein